MFQPGKVEVQRHQLVHSTATCSATERFPHWTKAEMSSFPVNVWKLDFVFCLFILHSHLAVRLSVKIIR